MQTEAAPGQQHHSHNQVKHSADCSAVLDENVHPNFQPHVKKSAVQDRTGIQLRMDKESFSFVKVVDMKSEGAAELFTNSLKETGFAVVTNHGIDSDLVLRVYEEWRCFYMSGKADQDKYLRDNTTQDGFFNIREAESAKGMQVRAKYRVTACPRPVRNLLPRGRSVSMCLSLTMAPHLSPSHFLHFFSSSHHSFII